jgi:hypothetical protein
VLILWMMLLVSIVNQRLFTRTIIALCVTTIAYIVFGNNRLDLRHAFDIQFVLCVPIYLYCGLDDKFNYIAYTKAFLKTDISLGISRQLRIPKQHFGQPLKTACDCSGQFKLMHTPKQLTVGQIYFRGFGENENIVKCIFFLLNYVDGHSRSAFRGLSLALYM